MNDESARAPHEKIWHLSACAYALQYDDFHTYIDLCKGDAALAWGGRFAFIIKTFIV